MMACSWGIGRGPGALSADNGQVGERAARMARVRPQPDPQGEGRCPRDPVNILGVSGCNRSPSKAISTFVAERALTAVQFAEVRRAALLAGFHKEAAVEAAPAARRNDAGKRREVDAGLAVVVGRAGPVEPAIVPSSRNGCRPLAPATLLVADYVVVGVLQDRLEGRSRASDDRRRRPLLVHVGHPLASRKKFANPVSKRLGSCFRKLSGAAAPQDAAHSATWRGKRRSRSLLQTGTLPFQSPAKPARRPRSWRHSAGRRCRSSSPARCS